jgi:hypothetical protein
MHALLLLLAVDFGGSGYANHASDDLVRNLAREPPTDRASKHGVGNDREPGRTAHGEGRWFIDSDALWSLDERQG